MLHWAIAIVAVAVGIFPADGSSAVMSPGFWREVHPVFGLLLLALVFSQFYWRGKQPHAEPPADLRVFSRRLVCLVFLLVYIVILAKMGLVLLGPTGERAGEVARHLGGYVACGAAALVTIRILEGVSRRM